MKTTENIKLTTAGKLLGELEKYKKNHWDDCVVGSFVDIEQLMVGLSEGCCLSERLYLAIAEDKVA